MNEKNGFVFTRAMYNAMNCFSTDEMSETGLEKGVFINALAQYFFDDQNILGDSKGEAAVLFHAFKDDLKEG